MYYLFFAIQAVVSAAGVLLLRDNLDGLNLRNLTISPREAIPIIIGVFLYALSFVMWLIILSRVNISIAYPITIGLTLVFTLVGARLFLNESLGPRGALGIAMIVVGVILGGSKSA
jgi:multidrug transporter EmrE-like cation transporter